MGRRKRDSINLTTYGRRKLGSIYSLYKGNTDFDTVEEFYQYALDSGFRDWWIVDVDVKSRGLREDNISFSYATERVRADRLKLLTDTATYGSRCVILQDIQAQLIQLLNSIDEVEYELGRLGLSETDADYIDIKAYLNNQKRTLNSIIALSDKLNLKE